MQDQYNTERLLSLLLDGSISREDYDTLMAKIREEDKGGQLDEAADHVLSAVKARHMLGDAEREELYQRIVGDERFKAPMGPEHYKRKPLFWRYASAAAVLIFAAAGFYFYSGQQAVEPLAALKEAAKKEVVISPADDKAVLTLADGRQIILDSAENGMVAHQEGVNILKTSDGQIMYTFSDTKTAPTENSGIAFNTVETPAGGKYQVNLPDGTRVWLNSSSALRFPAMFSGDTRDVELSGEAFFDVSSNQKRPFRVKSKDQVVEVLGTQFNINSYPEEGAVKTTLIEGSVKVHYRDRVVMLNPGQQFQPSAVGTGIKATAADTEEVMSWKNGYFLFKDEDIHSVMRKISRWYDVEVVYSGAVPAVGFGGNISRSKDLDEVLAVLQLTNVVKFKVEGRRITVMP
jgi:transmembrane sensor